MTSPKSMRVWFAIVGIALWTGICLTGFSNVHWFVYFPAIAFTFSATTGICPGQIAVFNIFGVKIKETSNQASD